MEARAGVQLYFFAALRMKCSCGVRVGKCGKMCGGQVWARCGGAVCCPTCKERKERSFLLAVCITRPRCSTQCPLPEYLGILETAGSSSRLPAIARDRWRPPDAYLKQGLFPSGAVLHVGQRAQPQSPRSCSP